MRFLLTDLRRGFTERTFTAAIILGVIILGSSYFYLRLSGEPGFLNVQSLLFPFVAPFLGALPFSGIIMTEVKTHYSELLKLRRKGKSYRFTRFLTVGLTGGAALLLPEILLSLFFGFDEKILNSLLTAFPFGFSFGVLSYALTWFNRESFLPLIIPEVIYLLLTYAFPYLGLEKFYPPLMISPYIYGSPDLGISFTFFGVITAVSLLITAFAEPLKSNNK
ncbi:MAG: hypothetical protein LBM87_02190 [Ruminococcus sp.]|jgi:hypothetical protein|nr:hypothetical protein [Ruminococcus sp.]